MKNSHWTPVRIRRGFIYFSSLKVETNLDTMCGLKTNSKHLMGDPENIEVLSIDCDPLIQDSDDSRQLQISLDEHRIPIESLSFWPTIVKFAAQIYHILIASLNELQTNPCELRPNRFVIRLWTVESDRVCSIWSPQFVSVQQDSSEVRLTGKIF